MNGFLPSRRRLMQAAGVLFANGLAPALSWPGLAAPALDWRQEFAAALARKPWLIGWRDPGVEGFDAARLQTEGRWPGDLCGRFLRNGPARYERGGQRYRHWFDGDGMVHMYTLASGRISHRARMVRTEKYQAEEQAGRFLVSGFGTRFRDTVYDRPDGVNVANTNLLPVADRLLALWEGGSAWSLDPATLEAQGPRHWRSDLVHTPFSAHPKVEPDGTIWNFGTPTNGDLLLYHIGADGQLKRFATLALDRASMIHDFIVTERHLVFLLAPLTLERDRIAHAGASFLHAHIWHGDQPTRVMAIPKDEPERVRRYDLAPGFAFHFGNGWEEADGVIRFDYCRRADPSEMYKTLSSVMRGAVERGAPARWTLATLYPDGRASECDVGPEVEFPRVDPRVVGRRNRHVYMLEASPKLPHPMFDTVVRRDVESGAADRYSYGPSFLVEEHCFIPRPGSAREGDGWLIGTALEWRRARTCLSLFDAANLAAGPMARAWLPYAAPLGFHGVWWG